MSEILRIHINITGFESVNGTEKAVNLVSFGGRAESELFSGEILSGGVDTQTVYPDGSVSLSARYILSGTDKNGNKCRIFIENSVPREQSGGNETSPFIITDSPVLAKYEKIPLVGYMEQDEDGLTIIIKEKHSEENYAGIHR